jgi:hypothetical protein
MSMRVERGWVSRTQIKGAKAGEAGYLDLEPLRI